MDWYVQLLVVILIAVLLIAYVFKYVGSKKIVRYNEITPKKIQEVLESRVSFYARMNVTNKEVFQERVSYFLQTTKISPEKGALLTDEDKVLIAASATIPLFHFHHWAYENLDEVLVYPDYFDEKFGTVSDERNVAGMVGTGALNHMYIPVMCTQSFQAYPPNIGFVFSV